MRLTVFSTVLASYEPIIEEKRARITDADRDKYLRIIRDHVPVLEDIPEAEPFAASFGIPGERFLAVTLWRYGNSLSAVWSETTAGGAKPIAVSLQLMGVSGANDVAAVELMRQQGPPEIRSSDYNRALAQNRPCVAIIYLAGEWVTTGEIEMAAVALCLASNSSPASFPTIRQEQALSPAQEVEIRKELEQVCEVFKIIQTNWASQGSLNYTVRPSEPIAGRPVESIMHVQFWVGVNGRGRTLGIQGLVAVFLMLRDYTESATGLKYMKRPQSRFQVNLGHPPAVLEAVLKQITIDEPV